MILFLDDCPNRAAVEYQRSSKERRENTIWCRTAQEAIDVLRDYELEEVNMDHDLNGEYFTDLRSANSGMEVVRWLEKNIAVRNWDKTAFIIHSHNQAAAYFMVRKMRMLGLNVKYVPFGFPSEVVLE